MKFFLTGHSGFKGTWLSILLKIQGHDVVGFSSQKYSNTLFDTSELSNYCSRQFNDDIRNLDSIKSAIHESQPDVIIHFAAQSLVKDGYLYPYETFDINYKGTLNLLESAKLSDSLLSVIIVTTDKVYKDTAKKDGYTEEDPLGGKDPYSSSKAASDILVQSWIHSFSLPGLNIARAGNVIGGGDWNNNRLIPDLIRSIQNKETFFLRNPNQIRPWQHVLDCLNGYFKLVEFACKNGESGVWNFGPDPTTFCTAEQVILNAITFLNANVSVQTKKDSVYPETDILLLNSSKSRSQLDWTDKFDLNQTLKNTTLWYKNYLQGKSPYKITENQISEFLIL